jgi:cytochrome c553
MAWLVATLALADDETARRILATQCLSCHGAAAMGGLDLRARESLLKGGGRGAAVVPGKAAESLLYQAVLRQGPLAMPPGKKGLSEAEVATLKEWIDGGANFGEAAIAARPSWWSFQKLKRPPGASSSIDAFVSAKLRERGLQPVPKAGKRELLRRVTFDLIGLPPTVEEIAAFEADRTPGAYAKVVDRLLASPRYGERWGRHWLDVVRYADTGGFETDIYFPNAWRYRDYVIESFNEDKPYDRFVQEQIAGDELFPDNLDLNGGFKIPEDKQRNLKARIATGMYTVGPVYHEAAFFGGQVRYEWLTDVVDTTGEAFMGLTLGCARCHNHKFDPLTQRDYHAMMAVFAGSEEREIPVVTQFSVFGFKSGYPNWLKVEELKAAVQRIDQGARKRVVDGVRKRFGADVLAAYDTPQDQRSAEQRKLAAQLEAAMTAAGLQENAEGKEADIPLTAAESAERDRLVVELGKATLKANPVPQTATVLDHASVTPVVHMTHRGDWRAQGEVVAPAFPAVIADGGTVEDDPQKKLARRKALALWLTEPDHPLTARVMVNRVWHWHFGRGIVGTPNDFGRQGDEPSHPELLDWLASEFVAQGWSLKKLHRLILLSETYQRSSAFHEANARIDANNRYLWRANRQRLDAETLRDAVLAASGALNLKMGGRPVIPSLSREEYSAMWARNQWPESLDPAEHTRRSVYLYVKRNFPIPMLSTFDAPDPSLSCSRRENTTVAPQALTLMNGDFMVNQAATLAAFARQSRTDPGERIDFIWQRALGRMPRAAERSKALAALGDQAALDRLCLVLLNTNEFLYVD